MLRKDGQVGEFILVERLGTGGFGDVWKAEKRTVLSTSPFAIKFFQAKDDEEIDIANVKKEIMIWQSLSGLPNIISVIEANTFEDYVYIVSEYAEGGSLDKWLRANGGKATSYSEAVAIINQILIGLEGMHNEGFVHRDLKPANVLLKKNILYLADFGISRQMKTHSKTMGTAGTYEYMPPEAFEGIPLVSVHTDIWATGVLLQKLLTGKLPFPQKEIPSLMGAILMREPEPLPNEVPFGLREVVKKALQKKREDRFQTVREMRESLKDCLKIRPEIIEPNMDSVVTIADINPIKNQFTTNPQIDWQNIINQKEAENLELQKQIQEARDLAKLADEERQKKQFEEQNNLLNQAVKKIEIETNQNNPKNRTTESGYELKADSEDDGKITSPIKNKTFSGYGWVFGYGALLFVIPFLIIFSDKCFPPKYIPANNSTLVSSSNNSRPNITINSGNVGNRPANSNNNNSNINSNSNSMTASDYFDMAFKICPKTDYDCQITNYTKVIELNPSNSYAFNNRGYAYKHKGLYGLAITDYNKAIEINPNDADFYNSRGVSYKLLGYYDLAIADYQKALQINPNVEFAKDNLNEAMRSKNNNQNKPANNSPSIFQMPTNKPANK